MVPAFSPLGFLAKLFSSDGFMPHGHCYLWQPSVMRLMVITDTLIGIAYAATALSLYYLIKKEKLPFSFMFFCFGTFIFACGLTHWMDVYTLWIPVYWLQGSVKLVTAIASVFTSIYLIPTVPKIVHLARNIRQSEQIKSDLEGLNLRLHRERDIRERFIASLTHDLLNPMAAVKISAQIMARDKESRKTHHKHLDLIIQNINRAARMTQDLLDADSLSAGASFPIKEITNFDLSVLAQTIVEALNLTEGRQILLKATGPVFGYWSRDDIIRVLENLTNNAVKYGAKDKPITVTVKEEAERVELSVHSFGNPISEEEQAKIFEFHHRTPSAEKGVQCGWGIGLALVRAITEAHGGQVGVRSSPVTGTTFSVVLPRDSRIIAAQKAA